MDKKHKCAYCKKEIDYTMIRCDDCNFIWNEGVKFGEDNIRRELKSHWYGIDELLQGRLIKE